MKTVSTKFLSTLIDHNSFVIMLLINISEMIRFFASIPCFFGWEHTLCKMIPLLVKYCMSCVQYSAIHLSYYIWS